MKRKIGIVGWKVGENSFGVTIPYLNFFKEYGEIVTIMPWSEIQEFDLIVLPGGPDINPLTYGAIPDLYLQKSCPYRESFDRNFLPEYISQGTPIFGICRGMQAIAVHFGAQLYQDMYHETNSPEKRMERVHPLEFDREAASILNLNYGKDKFKVNSLHHQVIKEETLSSEIRVIAKHPSCSWGGIEVIAHVDLPIAGVQYHPEEFGFDEVSDVIIPRLLEKKSIFSIETVKNIISE